MKETISLSESEEDYLESILELQTLKTVARSYEIFQDDGSVAIVDSGGVPLPGGRVASAGCSSSP